MKEVVRLSTFYGVSMALGIVALFLFRVSEPAAAALLGLFAIGMGYTCWRPAHKADDDRSGWAFAREVYKALPVLLTLLGAIVMVNGLGRLTGFELLTALSEFIADLLTAGGE